MKIFLITISAIIFFNVLDVFSQSYNPNKIGFFTGPSLSNISIETNPIQYSPAQDKVKFGYTAGISLDLLTSERFTFYSELFYHKKFGETLISTPFDNIIIKYNISYLSYDLSVRYDLAGKTAVPFVFLGPRIDFYLADEISTGSSAVPFPLSKNEVSEKIKRIGMGLSGGIGFEFYTGGIFSVQTSIQFSPSFYDIYKDEIIRVKSNSFELKIGSRF